ncbi:hypothetical protein CASFOL_005678 [Castilleja foliolosa]|uniref:RNase H type-1 domain-containing protein n=1 Tax=Castilleja foliolosa TaxID=1961234 RepID=A0ABD3E449_9LAMI
MLMIWLFCKATSEDAICIKNVLDQFSSWSSQMPNKDKSQIHFSNNTEHHTKNSILNILGFKDCDHKSKHLGMPFCKPKSRTAASQEIVDTICQKLSGWKSKMLSQAGRSIFVQSVALACPSYIMAVSKLPKNTTSKIDSLIRKFWWGSNSNGNSLMLKCWDSICQPKVLGGLGFRRLDDINSAMISKLAWSLACNTDTLWVQLLKAKYLRGKNFLVDNLDHSSPSWLWKDIVSCRDLLCKGAIFKVGINSTISIWNEPWIPSIPGFIPDKSFISPNSCNLNLLRDLMDSRSSSWKLDVLKNHFHPNVVNEILKIQISPMNRHKTLLWSPSKSGIFSTRSAYLLSQSGRFSSPSNPSASFNWNNLWKSKLHNRFKLLLWKIVNNIIPCRFIMMLLDINCKMFVSQMQRCEFLVFAAVLFDNIWLNRNLLLHGTNCSPVNKLVVSVSRQSNSHWLSCVDSMQIGSNPNLKWKKPPSGWYKINADSAFDNGMATTGIVFRNFNGSIIHAHTQTHSCLDSLTAECLAIFEACLVAERFKVHKAIFETDCLNAVSSINGNSLNNFWPSDPVVEKIKRAWSNRPMWTFTYTSRRNNGAAHELAKWAKNSNFVVLYL